MNLKLMYLMQPSTRQYSFRVIDLQKDVLRLGKNVPAKITAPTP
jgi:hypothetical protein